MVCTAKGGDGGTTSVRGARRGAGRTRRRADRRARRPRRPGRPDRHRGRGRAPSRALLFGRARCLPVGPLSNDDIAALITATGQPAGDVRALAARTGGDAFFVTELVRHGLDGDVPASVRAAVDARIAALPGGRDAVAAAAVLGVRFRLDVLADVLGVALNELRRLP